DWSSDVCSSDLRAGISRSLLFHYFPTKLDYLTALVRAAADHVLDLTAVPEGASTRDDTRAIVTALVRYIQRRRDNYVAVLRSGRSEIGRASCRERGGAT